MRPYRLGLAFLATFLVGKEAGASDNFYKALQAAPTAVYDERELPDEVRRTASSAGCDIRAGRARSDGIRGLEIVKGRYLIIVPCAEGPSAGTMAMLTGERLSVVRVVSLPVVNRAGGFEAISIGGWHKWNAATGALELVIASDACGGTAIPRKYVYCFGPGWLDSRFRLVEILDRTPGCGEDGEWTTVWLPTGVPVQQR